MRLHAVVVLELLLYGHAAVTLEECLFERAFHQLNRELFGKYYYKRGEGLLVFVAWEEHQDGTPHAHGLVKGFSPEQRAEWQFLRLNDFFFERLGIARWYPIDGDDFKRAKYVAKYCTKAGGEDNWNLLGPWQRTRGGLFVHSR